MKLDPDSLTLTEIIQLQTQLSQSLQRRFEKQLALCFTDVAGSTEYFARYGDEAGRRLTQRHIDLLSAVLPAASGRIVDTAGDGAFTCFPRVESARQAMVELQQSIMRDNFSFSRDQQLSVRCGLHYGNVLTDGTVVTGDAVNLCARVASASNGCEIRVSRAAFQELSPINRLRCRDLKLVDMKGFAKPVEVLTLEWRDTSQLPTAVRIVETGQEFPLPDQDVISFGRLREHKGVSANDIVIELPDAQMAMQISRWHFELRRQPEGFVLRPVSDQVTEVDGVIVPRSQQVPLRPGMKVRLARITTLEFKTALLPSQSSVPEAPNTFYAEPAPK